MFEKMASCRFVHTIAVHRHCMFIFRGWYFHDYLVEIVLSIVPQCTLDSFLVPEVLDPVEPSVPQHNALLFVNELVCR